MLRDRRPSAQTVAILTALAAEPLVWRYGYELGLEVGLKSGSLYPILARLSDRGLLDSAWEKPASLGRPARHLYRLSARGLEYASEHSSERREARAPKPAPALRSAS